MREAVEGAEADYGVAGCGIPDMARVERHACGVAFADADEGCDVGCFQLGLAAQPPQRVPLPSR